MEPFKYTRVTDSKQAVERTAEVERGKFVAGGTNLLDFVKLNVERPGTLVDINPLPLNKIDVQPDRVHVGALVLNSDLAYHEVIRQKFPVLSQALLAGATPQIRNMATVGGNLLQRTRCTYFRDTAWPCNKREPGSGCPAIEGDNRSHAILGTSEQCIATHPSDMCVALAMLDCVIETTGPQGARRIPYGEFHIPYGEDPARESVLAPGELITGVVIPFSAAAEKSHYIKVRDRASFEFALVSVAAGLEIKAGRIASARIALGGTATKPWRVPAAEKVLVGEKPDAPLFELAASVALQGAKPQKHNGFKVDLARQVIRRCLAVVRDSYA